MNEIKHKNKLQFPGSSVNGLVWHAQILWQQELLGVKRSLKLKDITKNVCT